jgi:hypothetical protein
MIVDVNSREEAALLVPPLYRSRATIVRLTKFTIEDVGTILAQHKFDKRPDNPAGGTAK